MRIPPPRVLAALLLGLLAWSGMGVHTGLRLRGMTLWDHGSLRRVWQDTGAAIAQYLDVAYPMRAGREHRARGDMYVASRQLLAERAYREEVPAWAFWRTVRVEPFLRARGPAEVDRYDDPGRASLMALGYLVLGGISPFLLFWVAWIAAGPVVVWLVAEIDAAAGRAAAAGGAALLALSPYLVDAFALPRSAVGFYVLAVLVSCAYALRATFPTPTVRGVLAGTIGASLALAVCTYCRSGAVLLLPAFAAAAGIASWRLGRARGWRRGRVAAVALGLVVILAVPAGLMRQKGRGDTWIALWEGLGDYDRTRGHIWSDEAAEAFLRQQGLSDPLRSDAATASFRRNVLDHVRESPGWYAGIVARRAGATLLQTRLWPWEWTSGISVAPATTPNEGHIRKYYGYVTPIDFLGFGRAKVELPVPLLLVPAGALVFLAARRADAAARSALLALGCVAVGASVLPVAVTTAGAIETQAFALVYVIAAPLALGIALRRRPADVPTR